jgi:hypothetical protein
MGFASAAHASIYDPSVLMIPKSNPTSCLIHGVSSFPSMDSTYCYPGSPSPEFKWAIESSRPDQQWWSNAQIQNLSSGQCLEADQSGWNNGFQAEMKGCDSSNNYQIWAVTHANGYTFFYNFASQRCLDAGQGHFLYGPVGGCDANNPYQSWSVPAA